MTRASLVRACLLAALAAFVTLFVQVLVHRVISAKLLNNYAFLVISLTMLGFAFSGAMLTRWLEPVLERFGDALTGFAAGFVLSLLGAAWLFYRTPGFHMIPPERLAFLAAFLRSMPLALLFAIPFIFVGLILGVLLSARHLPTPRVYFFDLAGSALGAFAVIPAISHLGVELSLVLACGLLLLGTMALAPPRDLRVKGLAGAAALAILLGGAFPERVFKMVYPPQSTVWLFEQFGPPYGVEHVAWDPVSRIELSRIPTPGPISSGHPSLIGSNRTFHRRFRRMLTQNNYAYTFAVEYDGQRESLTGIEETLYASAYHATSVRGPKVAVIGVGGGFDVLTALFFEASRIRAVEINAATIEIVTSTFADYFRPWVEDPRVELVAGEGRHHLTAIDERFDVLQLSGVDSYSGTAGAAHVFSESYLYTEEAWDLYLSRLSDDGIICMMRLEMNPPREMLRAMTTAVAALRRASVKHPADHVITVTESGFSMTALLVKKTPFTREEEQRVAQWAEGNEYLVYAAGPSINNEDSNNYQRFLNLADPKEEARFIASAPFDISPVPDDRPFFFKYSFWWHLWSDDPLLQKWAPVMELSVVLLFALVGLATYLCVALPLRYLSGLGAAAPGTRRYGIFFAGCGIGFMAVEIALLQKFGLFLGHPNYALSVVLAALLVSSGLGALVSSRTIALLGGIRFVSYALCFLLLAMRTFVFPSLEAWIAWPLAARIALVFAVILPIGLCLGVFVPAGLERIKRTASAYTPWAWGINGIFSVMGPILAVAFSVTWGNTALLLLAAPIYLGVGFALPEAAPEAA